MPKKTFDDWIFSEGSQNLRESRQTLQVASMFHQRHKAF